MPDVNKMKKNVTSLRWENLSFQAIRMTRCCPCARIRKKLYQIVRESDTNTQVICNKQNSSFG